MDVARRLGELVREQREALELSQEELAHRTDLSQRQIWEIEHAKTSPQLVTWLRLAHGLEKRLGELLLRAEALAAGGDAV
jgi:transcriptional regulator with XRE-family HTH domain